MVGRNVAIRIANDDDDLGWYKGTLGILLDDGVNVDTGHWQAITDVPQTKTVEIHNAMFLYDIPTDVLATQHTLKPNLPWAEEHFGERVSGIPHNPPPSHVRWPYAQAGNAEHVDETKQFSHTYPERLWPKYANDKHRPGGAHMGIRYGLGDLNNVVDLLIREPYTRQAYVPLWFPEDTGAAAGQRVPCTLGYHFMMRSGKLHLFYPIRSCDAVRHLQDDLYMAARLCQWMVKNCKLGAMKDYESTPWDDVVPGQLTMFASSLHCFQGETDTLKRKWLSE